MTKALADIRATFLNYFRDQGHTVVESSPLVPRNDPTLMFANSGMVQFKNVFTGAETRPYKRATTAQKCVRAGGKHNDLENVGYTARHLTFFEMMGNFSFGDYFKSDAIPFAWELVTKHFGLPKDKLLVTVYHDDDDAAKLWKKVAGFSDDKIIRIKTDANFWRMGDTGPCGPCSEIFIDLGDKIAGGPPGSPDEDGDRFLEFWNLVFMQYEELGAPGPAEAGRKRINLPKPSVDTGLGLERMASILQGVHSVFETDLFKSIIDAAAEAFKLAPQGDKAASFRVIADHLRATSFLIADGVLPGNEGRGYVLRRIMRRAMRHAHILGAKEPVIYRLVPELVRQMGAAYHELVRAEPLIVETLKLEESRFKQMLDRGLKLLDEESKNLSPAKALSGDIAFKLYDTFGFPLDLTQDVLRGKGLKVDATGFEAAMAKQKAAARAAWAGTGETGTAKLWFDLRDELGATDFLGYSTERAEGQIRALVLKGARVADAKQGETIQIIVNQTPFYAESGGQVGDTGILETSGGAVIQIADTQKEAETVWVHHGQVAKGTVKTGDTVLMQIDSERRARIRANHSATHLLHEALRRKLGTHVTQKGSLVAPDRLRFDFSQPAPIPADALAEIEAEVNTHIRMNEDVVTRLMTPNEAMEQGAMALFGEKYGEEVRVLSMGGREIEEHIRNGTGGVPSPLWGGLGRGGMQQMPKLGSGGVPPSPIPSPQGGGESHRASGEGGSQNQKEYYSVELCGGTHVKRTGDIGVFKIVSESAVSAGVRRIEAVTGAGALEYFGAQEKMLRDAAEALKATPVELPARVAQLVEERKKLEKEIADLRRQAALGGGAPSASEAPKQVNGVNFISRVLPNVPAKDLKPMADEFKKQIKSGVIALAASFEDKVSIVVAVTDDLTKKVSAVDLVKSGAEAVGGKGGGGRPDMAQAGGSDTSAMPQAIAAIEKALGTARAA